MGNHNLEAIEIGQVAADLGLGKLLGSAGGSPLVGNTRGGPALADGRSAGSTGEGNGELGQVDAADADDLALNLGGRSINNNLWVKGALSLIHLIYMGSYAVMIDNIGDNGELADVSSVVDTDDTSNFDKLVVHLL